MHIGFLTPEFPHELTGKSGGLGTSIKNLADALARKGVKISIFVYGQNINKVISDSGISLHIISQRKFQFFSWYFYRKFLQKYVNTEISLNRIDLIEAPDWTGISAFMNFRCPLVIRMNGSDGYFCYLENRKQKWKNRFLEKKALQNADHLISVSEFTAQTTSKIFDLTKKIKIIPNSIDLNKFKPSNEIPDSGHILYFGTLIRKKGIIELASAFNQLIKMHPESQLYLIGKDVIDNKENRSTLKIVQEHLSKEALSNIYHLPEVSYNEIRKYIGKSEIVVLPSFAEALPMTWLETMAMEKPFVSSNIGWANELMINEVTGFTVNPKMHKDFAEKISWLLENPGRAKEMGKNARKRVESKFSSDVVANKNLKFYQEIINN